MSLQRLIVSPEQVMGDQLRLTPEQQHYLYRVLRLTTGARFLALDGSGDQWMAELTSPGTATVSARPRLAQAVTAPTITLVMALPKGNGFDAVVRQATELGVTTLQPVITERTLSAPNLKKLDRWQRIAAEATEQCERLRLPQILPPLPWSTYLQPPPTGRRWLCVARHRVPHLLTVAQRGDPGAPIVLAIGPEGGWTEAELVAAQQAGFRLVTLGPHILRAVTAPLAALAIVTAATAVLAPPSHSSSSE
ncbi:MAG: 16S rRNA (uracil(1498)-N(3))-methyltransferase [Nodosilinea sp.]